MRDLAAAQANNAGPGASSWRLLASPGTAGAAGGLRRGQASLTQQLDRLTEAYLAGVVLLEEYRRRRSDLERRRQVLEQQQLQLVAQVDRRQELAGLSRSIEHFRERTRTGLQQATFDQKRKLVELLIDRVIVSDGEVEIRYVMPICKNTEHTRFCHLYLDYRARSPRDQTSGQCQAGLPRLRKCAAHDSRV
jgi:site-specific DNA recombinase